MKSTDPEMTPEQQAIAIALFESQHFKQVRESFDFEVKTINGQDAVEFLRARFPDPNHGPRTYTVGNRHFGLLTRTYKPHDQYVKVVTPVTAANDDEAYNNAFKFGQRMFDRAAEALVAADVTAAE